MTLVLNRDRLAVDGAALLAGGVVAVIAWEVFVGYVIPQLLGGPRFGPVGLVGQVLNTLIGYNPGLTVNTILHYLTGIVFYPVAVAAAIALADRIGLRLPAVVWGVTWGVATWFIALGVFASIAGFGFMLGFGAIAWWSLAGHLVYGFTAVTVFAGLRTALPRRQTA